jgi:hypothetical protein
MYKRFYNLQRNPFEITPDPSFLFATKKHNEALAALYYGVRRRKGFVVMTGEVGTGKTYLGSVLVAQCIEGLGACYTGSTSTMWSYTLTGAQLASLGTGFVDLSALQTSQYVVRLGVTTLDQVPAPEPTSLMLLGISTIGVSVWRKFLA